MKYILILVLVIVHNYALVQVNGPVSTSDSPMLLKILQIVDSAINDDHLLYVTLKLFKSLCACMRETLRHKEEKIIVNSETNSIILEDDLAKGELEIYKNIYNNTCIHLRQELGDKINRTRISENDEFSQNNINCSKNCSRATEKVQNISSDSLNTQLQNILYKALIETKDFHKYKIKRFNLFGNSSKRLLNSIQNSVIIILTLHSSEKITIEKNEEQINDKEVFNILHSNSTIDIDIIEIKHDDGGRLEHLKSDFVTECNLRSLYSFLVNSEKNNFTKVFKLLRRNGNIKIYLDVATNKDHNMNFSTICCHSNKSTKWCKSYFKNDTNESQRLADYEKVIQKQKNVEKYKDTIFKIKTLIKLYDKKLSTDYRDSNADHEHIKINKDIRKSECLGSSNTDLTINNNNKTSPQKSKRQFSMDYLIIGSNYSYETDHPELILSKNTTEVKERKYGEELKSYTKLMNSSKQIYTSVYAYILGQNNNATSNLLLHGLARENDITTLKNKDKVHYERSFTDINLSNKDPIKPHIDHTNYTISELKVSTLTVEEAQKTPILYTPLPQTIFSKKAYIDNQTMTTIKDLSENKKYINNLINETTGKSTIHFTKYPLTEISQILHVNTNQKRFTKVNPLVDPTELHTFEDSTITNNNHTTSNLNSIDMERNDKVHIIERRKNLAIPYNLTTKFSETWNKTAIVYKTKMNSNSDVIRKVATERPLSPTNYDAIENLITSTSSKTAKVLAIKKIPINLENSSIHSSSYLIKSITMPKTEKSKYDILQSTKHREISERVDAKRLFYMNNCSALFSNNNRSYTSRENVMHEYNKTSTNRNSWKLSTVNQIITLATRGSYVTENMNENSNFSVNEQRSKCQKNQLNNTNHDDTNIHNKSFSNIPQNKTFKSKSAKVQHTRVTTSFSNEYFKIFNENITFRPDNSPNKNKNFIDINVRVSATTSCESSNVTAILINKPVTIKDITQLYKSTTQHSKSLNKRLGQLNTPLASILNVEQADFKNVIKLKNIELAERKMKPLFFTNSNTIISNVIANNNTINKLESKQSSLSSSNKVFGKVFSTASYWEIYNKLEQAQNSLQENVLEVKQAYIVTPNKFSISDIKQRAVVKKIKEPEKLKIFTYTFPNKKLSSAVFKRYVKTSVSTVVNTVTPEISTTENNLIVGVERLNQEYETQIVLPLKIRSVLITQNNISANKNNSTEDPTIILQLKNPTNEKTPSKMKNKIKIPTKSNIANNYYWTEVNEHLNMTNDITSSILKEKTNFEKFNYNGVDNSQRIGFYHLYVVPNAIETTNRAYVVESQQSNPIVDNKKSNQSGKDQTRVLNKELFTSTPKEIITITTQSMDSPKIDLLNKGTTIEKVIMNSRDPTEEHMLTDDEKLTSNKETHLINKDSIEITSAQSIINTTLTNTDETKLWNIKKVVKSEEPLEKEFNNSNKLNNSLVKTKSRYKVKENSTQDLKIENITKLLNKSISKFFDNTSLVHNKSINKDNNINTTMEMIGNKSYEGLSIFNALGYNATKICANVTKSKINNTLCSIKRSRFNSKLFSSMDYLEDKIPINIFVTQSMTENPIFTPYKTKIIFKNQSRKPQIIANVEDSKQFDKTLDIRDDNTNATETNQDGIFKYNLEITTVSTTPHNKIELDKTFTISSEISNENHFNTLLPIQIKKIVDSTEMIKDFKNINIVPKTTIKNCKYSETKVTENNGNNNDIEHTTTKDTNLNKTTLRYNWNNSLDYVYSTHYDKDIYRKQLQNVLFLPESTSLIKKQIEINPLLEIILPKLKTDKSNKKSGGVKEIQQKYSNDKKYKMTAIHFPTAEVTTNHVSNKKGLTKDYLTKKATIKHESSTISIKKQGQNADRPSDTHFNENFQLFGNDDTNFTKGSEKIIPLSIYTDMMLITKDNISKDEHPVQNDDKVTQSITKHDRQLKGPIKIHRNKNNTVVIKTPNNLEVLVIKKENIFPIDIIPYTEMLLYHSLKNYSTGTINHTFSTLPPLNIALKSVHPKKNNVHKNISYITQAKRLDLLFTNTTSTTLSKIIQTAQTSFKPPKTKTPKTSKAIVIKSKYLTAMNENRKIPPYKERTTIKIREHSHIKGMPTSALTNDYIMMTYLTNFVNTTHHPMLGKEKIINPIIFTMNRTFNEIVIENTSTLKHQNMYENNLEHTKKNESLMQNNIVSKSFIPTSISWKRGKTIEQLAFKIRDAKKSVVNFDKYLSSTKFTEPATSSYKKVDLVSNPNLSENFHVIKTGFESFTAMYAIPGNILKSTKKVTKNNNKIQTGQLQSQLVSPRASVAIETDENDIYSTTNGNKINNTETVSYQLAKKNSNVFVEKDSNTKTHYTTKIVNTKQNYGTVTLATDKDIKITTGNENNVFVKLFYDNKPQPKAVNTNQNNFTDKAVKNIDIKKICTEIPTTVTNVVKNIITTDSLGFTYFNIQNLSRNSTSKLKQDTQNKFTDNIENKVHYNKLWETTTTLSSKNITTNNDSFYTSSSNVKNGSKTIITTVQAPKIYLPIFLYKFNSDRNTNIEPNGIKSIKISKVAMSKGIFDGNNKEIITKEIRTTTNIPYNIIRAKNKSFDMNKRIELTTKTFKTSDIKPTIRTSSILAITKLNKIKYNTYKPNSQDDIDSSDESNALNTVRSRKNNKENIFSLLKTTTVRINTLHKNLNNYSNQSKYWKKDTKFANKSKDEIYKTVKKADKNEHTIVIINDINLISNEAHLLESLEKTNLYPIKMSQKSQRKVMKRIRFQNKKENLLSMNANKYFSNVNTVTHGNFYQNTYEKSHVPFSIHTATPLSKQIILKPKFESIANLAFVNNFRPKSLLIPNNEDFFNIFKHQGRRTGADWKGKKQYVKDMKNQFNTIMKPKFEAVMERPTTVLEPITKPRFLRDRIDSIRSYLYNIDNAKVTKPPKIKSYFLKTLENSEDQIADYRNINRKYFETPKITTLRTPRRGRTLFFLSPTAPYRRYY